MKANHSFPANQTAPMLARLELGHTLRGAMRGERLDDVRVATSELVTNAVIHGRISGQEQVWVEIDLDEELNVLRVTVEQPLQRHPSRVRLRSAPILFVSSVLLDELTDRWGTAPGPPALAWFEVDLVAAEQPT